MTQHSGIFRDGYPICSQGGTSHLMHKNPQEWIFFIQTQT